MARLTSERQLEIYHTLLDVDADPYLRDCAISDLAPLLNNVVYKELAAANLYSRLRGTTEFVQDLKQEALLELLRYTKEYSPAIAQYVTFAETKFRTAIQRFIRNWRKSQHISTCDSPISSDDSATLEQVLTSPEDAQKQDDFLMQIFENPIEHVLSMSVILSPLQARVVRLRFENSYSFRDIGQRMNISHEEARRLYVEAMETCKYDRLKRQNLINERVKKGAYLLDTCPEITLSKKEQERINRMVKATNKRHAAQAATKRAEARAKNTAKTAG